MFYRTCALLALLICSRLLAQESALDDLKLLFDNSTRGLSEEKSYVDTRVTFESDGDDLILIIREAHHAGDEGRSVMIDRREINCSLIESVAIHRDPRPPYPERPAYIVVTYGVGDKNKDAYRFESEEAVLGTLKAVRLGCYTEELAELLSKKINQLLMGSR